MKTLSIIYSAILAMFLFAGCRKDDNAKVPDLERVPLPLITKDASTDVTISSQEPETFAATFNVDLYYKDDIKPQKFDVVIIKNGDKSNVKSLQDGVTTFPVSLQITGPQLATLFGSPIVLGDKFDIGVNITTQEGKVFQAFPLTGVAYNANIAALANSSTSVRYEAICKFNPEDYAGDFKVVTDDWADYAPGDIVAVTVIDDTHLSFKYLDDNARPIIVEVKPDNTTFVAKQVYGDGYGLGYGEISCETVPSADNYVGPCEGILSVRLKHTVAAGSFGDATITLQKIQ
ncbi:hypothetical protein [Agriterribacter humi]|jgi:hypothetical protein|uniref:hypothetical protein n=1 Tax=Agriterribacter humi TaxID=1104781 RepID=UPI0012654B72|nr:hypothetical protein [Agriterribacter humi]